jgi:hypothetical protein
VREADLASDDRVGALLESMQLLTDVDVVVGDTARRFAVVPDPLTGGRRVKSVRSLIVTKLC